MPGKKTADGGVNKSAFIREHSSKSPQEIVALGKEKGIELSIGLVYAVRSDAKNKGKKKKKGAKAKPAAQAKKPAKKSAKGARAHSTGASFSADEKHLLALVKKVGVARAEMLVGLAGAFFAL